MMTILTTVTKIMMMMTTTTATATAVTRPSPTTAVVAPSTSPRSNDESAGPCRRRLLLLLRIIPQPPRLSPVAIVRRPTIAVRAPPPTCPSTHIYPMISIYPSPPPPPPGQPPGSQSIPRWKQPPPTNNTNRHRRRDGVLSARRGPARIRMAWSSRRNCRGGCTGSWRWCRREHEKRVEVVVCTARVGVCFWV